MRETVQLASRVRKIKFSDLENTGSEGLNQLIKDYGTVYVTSITRDGCAGCMEQKPLYEELARKIWSDHKGKTVFNNIHVQYETGSVKESEQAKRMLRHVAYPTYMIHVKSGYGILEAYRAVYPRMEELERQIMETFELADHYKKDQEKPSID